MDWNHWRKMFLACNHDTTNDVIRYAEERNTTPIEKITYLELTKLYTYYGMYHLCITPQTKIGDFIVDFRLLYELPGVETKKIVIECDGHDFHEKTKEQATKDKRRDRELQKQGYSILRYSGSDIVRNPYQISTDVMCILGEPEWMKNERSISNE